MKKVLFVFAFIICALFSVHLDARDVTRDVIGMRGEPIDKSKVMKAKRVCVPGLELICEDGIFKIKGQAWITRFSDDEKEELKNIVIVSILSVIILLCQLAIMRLGSIHLQMTVQC